MQYRDGHVQHAVHGHMHSMWWSHVQHAVVTCMLHACGGGMRRINVPFLFNILEHQK